MHAAATPDKEIQPVSSASNALQEIFYAVAHDFRRPIRQIIAFTSLLSEKLQSDLDDEAREWLSYVEAAGAEAQIMLERLLTYSRLHNVSANLSMIDIGELCETAIAELSTHKPAASQIRIEGNATIQTDPQLLNMALLELLDNALSYGDSEVVTIAICPQGEGVRISVISAGDGIAPDQVECAMRPFGRIHDDHPDHVGMGLNICQSALTLIGGTMALAQGDGRFSVHVELP